MGKKNKILIFFVFFLFSYVSITLAQPGSLKWRFRAKGKPVPSSPAIGPDGTIYVGSDDHYLYAIYSESKGYQLGSPWPGFHYNCGRGGINRIGSP